MTRLVICAPPYAAHSAGIRCLHRLAGDLIALGVDARTCVYGGPPRWGPGPHREVTDPAEVRGAAVLYPEVISDHPLAQLGPARVIRYLLNRPGAFTGVAIDYGPVDLVVRHSRVIDPEAPVLFVPYLEPDRFNLDDAPSVAGRKHHLTYRGKGKAAPGGPPDAIEMTRSWPADRDELAFLLKHAATLTTSDPFTALVHEALLCGCAPVVVDWSAWPLGVLGRYELPAAYDFLAARDFSPAAVESARADLLAQARALEAAWPGTLRDFVRRYLT